MTRARKSKQRTENSNSHGPRPGTLALRDSWLDRYPASTARGYRTDLSQFTAYLNADPLTATRPDVQRWIKHLTRRGLAAPTIRRKASAVSSFLRYCAEEGAIATNPAAYTRRPSGETAIRLGLDTHQAIAVLAAAEAHSPLLGALCWLLVGSALRISEALGLDLDDVLIDGGQPVVRTRRKGGKTQAVRISRDAAAALATLTADRTAGPIFTNTQGQRLGDRRARTLIRQLGETAGITRLTPHLLRHTCATEAIRAGSPIEDVQRLLGHRDLNTTNRYLQALRDRDHSPVDTLAARLRANR